MYCPLCNEMSRQVSISIGPDYSLELKTFRKLGSNLHINAYCRVVDENNYSFKYNLKIIIDCESNLINKTVFDINTDKIIDCPINGYIYFYGFCPNCDSSINSYDIGIDKSNIELKELTIDSESIIINTNSQEFQITLDYNLNRTEIYAKDIYEGNFNDKKPIICQLFKIDYKNLDKTIKRIKTILLFN